MSKLHDNQSGFGVVEGILILVIVVLIGVVGFMVYKNHNKATITPAATSRNTVPTKATTPTSTQSTDPYAGWKTYTSNFEKLSFKYPADWQTSSITTNIPGADAIALKSPSGKVTVSWVSAITGLGGACDNTVIAGTPEAEKSQLGACTYFEVMDIQKVSGVDLNYVDGVKTDDGKTYEPWLALQSDGGITKSEPNIGYLLFEGKNNDFKDKSRDYGLQSAGLMGGNMPGGSGFPATTKAEAQAFFSTDEAKQAKLILISASY